MYEDRWRIFYQKQYVYEPTRPTGVFGTLPFYIYAYCANNKTVTAVEFTIFRRNVLLNIDLMEIDVKNIEINELLFFFYARKNIYIKLREESTHFCLHF